MDLIKAVQDGALGTWVRESSYGLFSLLIIHTLSMGLVVGVGLATHLRVLGLMKTIPLSRMKSFYPLMIWGLISTAASGVLLLVGYPAKALTNPLFYIKLTLALVAIMLVRRLVLRLFNNPQYDLGPAPRWAKAYALIGLVLWPAVLMAGKFIEYTYSTLLV
jgi:hypothetical protein